MFEHGGNVDICPKPRIPRALEKQSSPMHPQYAILPHLAGRAESAFPARCSSDWCGFSFICVIVSRFTTWPMFTWFFFLPLGTHLPLSFLNSQDAEKTVMANTTFMLPSILLLLVREDGCGQH